MNKSSNLSSFGPRSIIKVVENRSQVFNNSQKKQQYPSNSDVIESSWENRLSKRVSNIDEADLKFSRNQDQKLKVSKNQSSFRQQHQSGFREQQAQSNLKQSNKSILFSDIIHKSKSSLMEYCKNHLKLPSFSEDLINQLDALNESASPSEMFIKMFQILRGIFEAMMARQKEQPNQKIIRIRKNEAMKLKLMGEDEQIVGRSKSNKKINLEGEMQKVKKQLYSLKEENQLLQKKYVGLINEYKAKKNFYIGEIRKLTELINLSAVDVRKLALEKTKQADILQRKKEQKRSVKDFITENNDYPFQKLYTESQENEKIIYETQPRGAYTKNYYQKQPRENIHKNKFRNVSSVQQIDI